jgi:DNA-binding winged helix-turn-helix (wHTH) protein
MDIDKSQNQPNESKVLDIAGRWLHKMKGFTRISMESYQADQGDSPRHNKEVEVLLIRDYIVDLEHNLIYRNDKVKEIKPTVKRFLACLIDNQGKLVTKDELSRATWSSTNTSDTEITVLLTQLRAVFNDQARQPRFIETVGRQGYRFVAPVEKICFGVYAYKKN